MTEDERASGQIIIGERRASTQKNASTNDFESKKLRGGGIRDKGGGGGGFFWGVSTTKNKGQKRSRRNFHFLNPSEKGRDLRSPFRVPQGRLEWILRRKQTIGPRQSGGKSRDQRRKGGRRGELAAVRAQLQAGGRSGTGKRA